MIKIGTFEYKNFLDYFTDVMDRYFRMLPPISSNIYLSSDVVDHPDLRLEVAKHCHFPAIINILANDDNEDIRETARSSQFWQLIGRFQEILGFERKERKTFAQSEGHHNLVVLLLFEDDLEVMQVLLQNPALSTKMLAHFSRLLKERGRGRKDEQMLELAEQIIDQKKGQIVKISQINKAAQTFAAEENSRIFLHYLSDEDPTIRRSIYNILLKHDPNQLYGLIQKALEPIRYENTLAQFEVLTELIKIVNRRDDLRKSPINYLDIPKHVKSEATSRTVADYLNLILRAKRLEIVRTSSTQLTDFDNVILLAHCHVDFDINLRSVAGRIFPTVEMINLLNDVSTPRRVFKMIISILSRHEDELVQEKIEEARLRESHRLKDSLKEMELSVQAYFDIIFQSLGYHQINEYQEVLRSINKTEKQLGHFKNIFEEQRSSDYQHLGKIFRNVRQQLSQRLRIIYLDTSPKTIRELEYIQSIINEIIELKEMGQSSLRPGTPEDIESEIKFRARIIWQSALSAYLGRIKDLSEMVRKKTIKYISESVDRLELETEIQNTIQEIEKYHRSKIQCHLPNTCAVCNRRGCASERFLTECQFFIEEFVDNFVVEEIESAAS